MRVFCKDSDFLNKFIYFCHRKVKPADWRYDLPQMRHLKVSSAAEMLNHKESKDIC